MKLSNEQTIDLSKYLDPRLDEKILTLPLQFQYLPVEIISKQYTKLNSYHPYRIHYLGPRFTNTHILHKKYSVAFNQKEKHFFQELYDYTKYEVQMRKIMQSNYLNEKLQSNSYYKSSMFYRAFSGMNPTLELKDEFIFNSCFESGNLDCVIKVNPMEYDLFLRIDSNTRGHTQWFYFSVQNGKTLGKGTFNICNLTKPRTLYQQGMRPYVFSKKKYLKQGKDWQQDGQNVELIQSKLRYSIIYETLSTLSVYKLSFDYNFTQEDDEVFFAYSIPYTYSQMLKDVQRMPNQLVKKYVIGRSLTGVDIPILHITNHQNLEQKKNILIIGRTHPGQSNGSHLLKGFMDYLCSNNQHSVELRNRINFFIIPMANPDGVIMGNSRSSASGKDLNRQYLTSKRQLYPQVFYVKNLAYKLHKNHKLFMFFDFHGHSRKKNTFFYGPSYSISEPEYYKCRALAKIVEKINNSFRFYSCSFNISEQKKGTARAVFFQQYKIPYVFTIQSSIGLFYDVNKMKTLQFNKQEWQKMGYDICSGVAQFIRAYEQYEQIMKERRRQRIRRREKFEKKFKQKKFIQDTNLEQFQATANPVGHKKEGIMFQLMEQIRQMPHSKNIDPQASSDDHDDAEDLQTSKLKQFNNLIIKAKQKNQMFERNRINQSQSIEDQIVQFKKLQQQNEQMQIIKQIAEQKKSKSIKFTKSNNTIPLYSQKNVENKLQNLDGNKRKSISLYQHSTINSKLRQQKISRNNIAIKQLKKNINNQTHRHLISKQFFPIDKCQIVDLPKSSIGMRKQVYKGRVMIDQYLKQKKMQKLTVNKNQNQTKNINTKRKIISLSSQKQDVATKSIGKFKIEDIMGNRSASQKKLMQKKNVFFRGQSSFSNRVFDSVLFSGFRGMEIDNMAMMIRTFNK